MSDAARWLLPSMFGHKAITDAIAGPLVEGKAGKRWWIAVLVSLGVTGIGVIATGISFAYGPGMWGNQTACGETLTPDLLGVAHKSLPCGTPVTLTYAGRTITVPVIDRGPYGVPGAQYDLTQAAAFTLGMAETETIGALPQPVAAASR